MKILSPWPWPPRSPRGGDGADKNFRPISTIMPNMNEIHQRVFKIWGLINFNVKTLTLWQKDEWMNVPTKERTYERTKGWTDERKSENYISPHTSYVGGIIILQYCMTFYLKLIWVTDTYISQSTVFAFYLEEYFLYNHHTFRLCVSMSWGLISK